jgi:hypothetical protein
MALVTVLIPTHDHCDTLWRSVASVQAQTVQDFEIFVVGDGAPARTAEIMRELCDRDSRIQYFPHPKGEGYGEAFRHEALQQANGKYVCYLGDDDLWVANHLEVMTSVLETCDFAHTVQMEVMTNGELFACTGNLNLVSLRQRMLSTKYNYFGPGCVGHTLSAYRRLPHGWRPRPDGMPSDLYMWKQWLSQDWCRFHSEPAPTLIKLGSPQRKGHSITQRCHEMDQWVEKIGQPGFQEELGRSLLLEWQNRVESPGDFHRTGMLAARHGDVDMAYHAFWRLIEAGAKTTDAQLQNYLAFIDVMAKLNEFNKAESVVREAIRYFPEQAILYMNLAAVLIRGGGNSDEATRALDKVLEFRPDWSEKVASMRAEIEQCL